MKINVFIRELLITLGILAATTGIGILFYHLKFTEANIITVYILGVLLTAIFTQSYGCSVLSSLASVLMFNFLFTEPRLTLHAYEPGYQATFAIMLLASLITGTLANENIRNAKEKEQADLLAQKEQLRANLLRAISHDLRTPLTSISGNAGNLLMDSGQLDDRTKNQMYLDIYDDSQWLVGLVENLLSVTRIEDGRLNFHMTTELVDEIVDEALNHINRRKTEHRIVTEYEDDLLFAKMDIKLIVQVIVNIVDNAIKYTPEGSVIRIHAGRQGEFVQVRISDNGNGVPDEWKEKVFDMFFTGDNKIVDSRRSMGLGLPLCKSIIDAHGGHLWIEDNVPHGAVFVFTLQAGKVKIDE